MILATTILFNVNIVGVPVYPIQAGKAFREYEVLHYLGGTNLVHSDDALQKWIIFLAFEKQIIDVIAMAHKGT